MISAKRIALCGVLSALAVTMMLLTVFPYTTYAAPAFAGMVLAVATLEFGVRYGVLCYFTTAVLAVFFTPDPEAKWIFVLLLGYYPIIHQRMYLVKRKPVAWALKLVLFNAAAVICYITSTFLLGIPFEEIQIGGVRLTWVLLPLANLTFLLYDIALSRFVTMYRVRLHPHIKRFLKL